MNFERGQGGRRLAGLALLALAFGALSTSTSVLGQRDQRARPSPQWRGDSARIHPHGRDAWRGGQWAHGRSYSHPGWGWSIGGLWYLAPGPVYPYAYPPAAYAYPYGYPNMYPVPQTVVVPQPPVQSWYWCEASRTYYPYVSTCPGGWQAVPAAPADASPVPP